MERIYTAQEIAEQLKIKKTTVYDLIKRGELNANKVGKQLRISQTQLDAYLGQASPSLPKSASVPAAAPLRRTADSAILQMDYLANNSGLIITSQESLMVELLRSHLSGSNEEYPMLHSYQNCYNSLYSIYWEKAHLALVALPHTCEGQPDDRLLYGLMPGFPAAILTLCQIPLGFYVKKGNPENITAIEDLCRPEIRFINRERGNECRILLDTMLKESGLSPRSIQGYQEETLSHLSTANAILSGKGATGMGDLSQLASFPQLEGVLLQKASMVLIIPAPLADHPAVTGICQTVQSPAFRDALEHFSGYSLEHSGELTYL